MQKERGSSNLKKKPKTNAETISYVWYIRKEKKKSNKFRETWFHVMAAQDSQRFMSLFLWRKKKSRDDNAKRQMMEMPT